ncbi:uncharacterized protein LOC130676102 [Microplitis mediator]|uniref:uncharacterized protein LOC130676102 n=1 Tax=Microplitis mediator TaxID=375433 RepID=UPI0025575DBF|nr:uncharacterized protein LOC130676102 [Microplitis mediator]
MPLFKVRTYNHPKKVCIEAESIAGLISKAIIKLKITTNEEFQIYLEDGTEVDEDDMLLQLATNSNLINILVILPVGLEWNDSFSNPLANSSATSSNSSSSSRSNGKEAERDKTEVNVNINRNKLELEFHSTLLPKFPTRLLDACKKGKVPLTKDRKDMVAIVATYMLQDLKDSSRGTALTISRKLVKLYPDSFEDKINGKRLGSGEGSLSKQIYQAVNTRKSVKKRIINEVETEGENLPAPHRDIGFYGCVDSLPTLPASDSVDVQEGKRIKLVDVFKNPSTESFDMVKLMDETFSLLRSHINDNTGSINPELFDNWPYLKSREVLLSHASRLLGIQVRETWDAQLNAKYTSILEFVQSWDTVRNFKLRKTKTKNTESGSSKPSAD